MARDVTIVEEFTVSYEVQILKVEYDDGEVEYEWQRSDGEESECWFKTAEEAKLDAGGELE